MKKLLISTVLVFAAVIVFWPSPAGADTISRGHLEPGQTVRSADGRYTLAHQSDGNVVLYDADRRAVWHTGTWGHSTRTFVMQPDGNLVLYAADGSPLWHSHTYSNKNAALVVQNDGNMVIYGPDEAIWASRVPQAPPAPSYTVWDRLAQCESSGNWHIDTGNGYRGGLQWSQSSWDWFKPAGAPYSAAHASREQEISAAERYRAYEQSRGRGGYGPWPSCASQLGLPR